MTSRRKLQLVFSNRLGVVLPVLELLTPGVFVGFGPLLEHLPPGGPLFQK